MTTMRRTLITLATATLAFALTGCTLGMTTEKMRELAEARDTCAELGGEFSQWPTEFGTHYRCSFDEGESDRD